MYVIMTGVVQVTNPCSKHGLSSSTMALITPFPPCARHHDQVTKIDATGENVVLIELTAPAYFGELGLLGSLSHCLSLTLRCLSTVVH